MEESKQTAQTEQVAQTQQTPPEPKSTEEMIPKKQFDEKVSKMNETIKQLNAVCNLGYQRRLYPLPQLSMLPWLLQ